VTRPSFIVARNAHDDGTNATAGSTESNGSSVSIRSVPPRCPVPEVPAAIHSDEPSGAAAAGALPTWTVAGLPDPGSISDTDPASWFVTQIPSGVAVTLDGLAPTGTVWAMLPVTGSRRVTVPSRVFAVHTPRASTAIELGSLPTNTVRTTPAD
jgi:hypothetical protein